MGVGTPQTAGKVTESLRKVALILVWSDIPAFTQFEESARLTGGFSALPAV
jgi:hypothetical protein